MKKAIAIVCVLIALAAAFLAGRYYTIRNAELISCGVSGYEISYNGEVHSYY